MNKRYFSIERVWCEQCRTGWVEPVFDPDALSQYYSEYYWDNRDIVDGQHVSALGQPNDLQLSLAQNQIEWIHRHAKPYSTVIDFGAGDCAAGYLLKRNAQVCAVDLSGNTQRRALHIGLDYAPTLAGLPQVDLIFSSHAIEHVHDIRPALEQLRNAVVKGGQIFLETPNLPDFEHHALLLRPPHTYTFSENSFAALAPQFGLKLIAAEAVGTVWRVPKGLLENPAAPDLRVLLERID